MHANYWLRGIGPCILLLYSFPVTSSSDFLCFSCNIGRKKLEPYDLITRFPQYLFKPCNCKNQKFISYQMFREIMKSMILQTNYCVWSTALFSMLLYAASASFSMLLYCYWEWGNLVLKPGICWYPYYTWHYNLLACPLVFTISHTHLWWMLKMLDINMLIKVLIR